MDPEVARLLGLVQVSDEEHLALEALKKQYPGAVFDRAPDGSVRATGPPWPEPVRAANAAELAEALRLRGG